MKYDVKMRDNQKTVIESDDVQISPQGSVKFINGKGKDAVLIAFFNQGDVVSVIKAAVQ